MYSLSAFKTYDIRGIWQEEIDEVFGLRMGLALGKHLKNAYQNPQVLISSDVREANNELITAFLQGIYQAGVSEVTRIGTLTERHKYGVCSTPFAYYAAQDFDCTCIFTASHNPSEYVGAKIVDRKSLSIRSSDLREMFEKETSEVSGGQLPTINEYALPRIHELLENLKQKFSQLTDSPKFTIDYSHGAATHFEKAFIENTIQSTSLFTTPDGSFPAHETDTSRFANYQPLLEEIQKNGSEFGFIFDGDADRFGMILPDGTVVTGDILLAIIAEELFINGVAEHLGSKVVFQEVFCGRIVGDVVKKYQGELHITRVGRESFVREVIENNGLLAGEVSTHLLFKEYGTIEMPLAGLYYLLQARKRYGTMTQLVEAFNHYARGQVLQFRTEKKDEVIAKLKENYQEYTQITIDGIRIESDDWWFCVRKSGTEPLLKVALEGKNQIIYDDLLRGLRDFFAAEGAIEKI